MDGNIMRRAALQLFAALIGGEYKAEWGAIYIRRKDGKVILIDDTQILVYANADNEREGMEETHISLK